MNFKEIKVEVDRLLTAGHSKYEVFNRMSGQGVTNDKLALIIALYADPRRVAANKIWINTLLTLILIQALLSFFVGLGQGINSHSDMVWLWGVEAVFFPLACWLSIYKNNPLGYNLYFLFLALSLKDGIDASKATQLSIFITVGVAVGIGYCVWFVKQKIFPDLVFTKARKVNNVYVFTDWNINKGPFSEGNTSQISSNKNAKIRKNVWVIAFLIFYILYLLLISSSFHAEFDRRWVFDLELSLHSTAIICIVFYILY